MRLATVIVVAVVILGAATSLTSFVSAVGFQSSGPVVTETVDRTVAFPSGGTVRLRTFSGQVHITGGTRSDVVVHAVRHASRDRLDHVALAIDTMGSTVSIEANRRDASWSDHNDSVVETAFEVQVPSGAKLDVESFSSPIEVSNVIGTQHLKTFSALIRETGGKDAVSAETFSGEVDVDVVAAGAAPDVTSTTFSGSIRARVAQAATGDVRFDSFSGSFNSEIPLTLHSMARNHVSADLPAGGGGGSLRFHTFSGDVRVTK